jgi:1-aminocyclopropane-1-carboxylate deaminase/D-cysteine desulfhydrase-like pyridoxal-dependent ACC family enzyme
MARWFGVLQRTVADRRHHGQSSRLGGGFIGASYGIPSTESGAAPALAARGEGVVLDPTYTAKALAGYRALLGSSQYRDIGTTLFLRSGGLPSVFVNRDEGGV